MESTQHIEILRQAGLRPTPQRLAIVAEVLLRHHPTVIAAVLHRDHTRTTDDATMLVIRDRRDPNQVGAHR